MTEGELRQIAFTLATATKRPGGCEPLVDALHRLLTVADEVLRAEGIILRYERVLPPGWDAEHLDAMRRVERESDDIEDQMRAAMARSRRGPG